MSEAAEPRPDGGRRRRRRRRGGRRRNKSAAGGTDQTTPQTTGVDAAGQENPDDQQTGSDNREAQGTVDGAQAPDGKSRPPQDRPRSGKSDDRNGKSRSDRNRDPKKDRGRPRRSKGGNRFDHVYGVIDLGTNNCRLLVAEPEGDGFSVVDAFSRIVRLGEGLGQTGRLADAAMDRAIEALKICADKMRRRRVSRSWSIATQACRLADNGQEFRDRVKKETGLTLEIISPEQEARLAVSGCLPLIDKDVDRAIVFDIGGGSTEMIWLDVSVKPPRIIDWTSLEIGVVTLAEALGGHDVTPESYDRMVADVEGRMAGFAEKYAVVDGGADVPLSRIQVLGTSGTVTTLAGIYLGLPRYDRAKVDGLWMKREDVLLISHKLAKMTYDQRVAQPCIGKERGDLVVAGCAILEAISDAWPHEKMRVADRGLREGMLLQLMEDADRSGGDHGANRSRGNRGNRNRRRRRRSGNRGNRQQKAEG